MPPDKTITTRTRLGFLGLGYLGSRIARRLAKAGFPLVVWDRDSKKAAQFSNDGVELASTPAELARKVDVVLSCLADDRAVEDVYFGAGQILGIDGPYRTIVELSTIAPESAQRLHAAGREIGISVLDVAISGSTPAAESGTLTLFGGGARTDFEASESLFRTIASQWFYMGPGGSGMAMKLVVNTLLGLGMQAIAESLTLGSAFGLPREVLFNTLAKTPVVPPALTGKLASAKQSDYTTQFPVRLMRKDFELILNEAARLKLWMPATEAAAVINLTEAANGREEDFSAVIRRMEQEAAMDWSVPPAA
jgi:3-hydroxyisobutyrate dehydrogenase-like beta-hydroxyacid dehydrogenase